MMRPLLATIINAFGLVLIAVASLGCEEHLRVGDYVWVEWCDERYPAYILDLKGSARVRVHYDGVSERFDEDIPRDRVIEKIEGSVPLQAPPDCVRRAMGVAPKANSSATAPSDYKPGDKIKVRWRNSVYTATILEVLAPGRFRVHYEGHESAWDETIERDRIVTKRR